MSIGLIDSGIGGLTTLYECIKTYPQKDYIYIADTLYAPYGSKSKEFLINRANTLINFLREKGAQTIIFACNTCSASTVGQTFDCQRLIRVLPPIEIAMSQTKGKVLLLATPATINSDMINNVKHDRLIKIANARLATLVEEYAPNFFKLRSYLKETLQPYSDCEAIIPGCTHYIFLTDIIKELYPAIKIYQSNHQAVSELSELKPEINYKKRQIIITGKGNEYDYYRLLNNLLNN